MVYNAAPVPTSAQKLVVVGGTEATNVPLAQPMIPMNNNYGYGQPVYYNYNPEAVAPQNYGNQQPPQYAPPSGIPNAEPSAYPSYQPYAPYGGQQQPQPMVLPPNQPY